MSVKAKSIHNSICLPPVVQWPFQVLRYWMGRVKLTFVLLAPVRTTDHSGAPASVHWFHQSQHPCVGCLLWLMSVFSSREYLQMGRCSGQGSARLASFLRHAPVHSAAPGLQGIIGQCLHQVWVLGWLGAWSLNFVPFIQMKNTKNQYLKLSSQTNSTCGTPAVELNLSTHRLALLLQRPSAQQLTWRPFCPSGSFWSRVPLDSQVPNMFIYLFFSSYLLRLGENSGCSLVAWDWAALFI